MTDSQRVAPARERGESAEDAVARGTVTAVLWDFDGTLADTLERNLAITRTIYRRLTGRRPDGIAALTDSTAYGEAVHSAANWRALYVESFDIPIDRTPEAAELWSTLHRGDDTPPPLFDGVGKVVRSLADRRQGIVSQNGRENIERALTAELLRSEFDIIVADEDLPFERQKPEPDGLLQAIDHLHPGGVEATDIVLYVGDHPVDVECVRRAKARASFRLMSVGAEYGDAAPHRWVHPPDFTARTPVDLVEIIAHLDDGVRDRDQAG